MNEQRDPDLRDEALLRLLADASGPDLPPTHVVAAAKEAFVWRTIDAELAALTYDSIESDALAGVRGGGARSLTFEAGDALVELEIEEAGVGRHLQGQVTPQDVALLELQRVGGDEVLVVDVDRLGRFRLRDIPSGRWRLRCSFQPSAGGGALFTEWMLL